MIVYNYTEIKNKTKLLEDLLKTELSICGRSKEKLLFYFNRTTGRSLPQYLFLYYFGPSMLYERTEDELYNISDNRDRFSVTSVKSAVRNSFVNSIPGSELFMPSSTVWAILPYTLPNYSYNPTNICGATAAAMMLRYMDLHFNNNFVPASLESSDGVTLIQHLATYVQFITGSSAGTQSSGINAYL